MLKHGEVNPLDVFGLRQMIHCPPHFEVITFDLVTSLKTITDWIYEHLEGRFYIGEHFTTDVDSGGRVKMCKMVGFEIPEEASYFGLFLPNINVVDTSLW